MVKEVDNDGVDHEDDEDGDEDVVDTPDVVHPQQLPGGKVFWGNDGRWGWWGSDDDDGEKMRMMEMIGGGRGCGQRMYW